MPPKIFRIPRPTVIAVVVVILVNILLWSVSLPIFQIRFDNQVSVLILAYTLGLRHACDADHLAVIDNVTRRFTMSTGGTSASNECNATKNSHWGLAGLWFSLGHSTVVIVISLVLIITSMQITDDANVERYFGLVGGIVSTTMLILLAIYNSFVLHSLIRKYRTTFGSDLEMNTNGEAEKESTFFRRWLSPLMKTVDKPWRLYIVGLVFALGLDTATEVGVLTLSALSAKVQGWLCIFLPLLFTSGMCLVDLLNGVLMLKIYTAPNDSSVKSLKRRKIRLLYTILVTSLSVLFAGTVGLIGLFNLIPEISSSIQGGFWDFWATLADQSEIIGYVFLGIFASSFSCFLAVVLILDGDDTMEADEINNGTVNDIKTVVPDRDTASSDSKEVDVHSHHNREVTDQDSDTSTIYVAK